MPGLAAVTIALATIAAWELLVTRSNGYRDEYPDGHL
jgi:hypothetical protein